MANYISHMATTQSLDRPHGRIAYDVAGTGPLIVLVPGMGDLRSTYRFLAPHLVAAGYRVATTDLRGHGDSGTAFEQYGDSATAQDIVALVEELGGPALLVGNSMGAGAAAFAAAERPDLVRGLVLIGPFVRDGAVGPLMRLLFRVAMAPPWAAAVWGSYLPKLYAGRKPEDFEHYRRAVAASLRRPGYRRSFARTTRTSHAPVEARLGEIRAPALVVMGELDPDFPDPRAEADWIAEAVSGRVVMVPDAGHYPQSQQPEAVAEAVVAFLAEAGRDA